MFSRPKVSSPALGLRALGQWVLGSLSMAVKRAGLEDKRSRPSSAEVMNAWRYTSSPPYAFKA